MTSFLTKAQRQVLIDWYIDCLIDTESEFVDGSEDAERQQLASMNNSYFYEYVQEMMPSCMKDLAKIKVWYTNLFNKKKFTEALIKSGYVFDDEDYDGCYVKTDEDNLIHCYQEGEDEGEWNYVKMNEDFDVLLDVTFNPDADTIYSLIP